MKQCTEWILVNDGTIQSRNRTMHAALKAAVVAARDFVRDGQVDSIRKMRIVKVDGGRVGLQYRLGLEKEFTPGSSIRIHGGVVVARLEAWA